MAKYMLIMRSSGSVRPPGDGDTDTDGDTDMDAMITAVGRFNESMIEAGVLAGGDGLSDPDQGAVVEFTGDGPVVRPGAYGDAQARFNGWWVVQVASQDEALAWAQRAPLGQGTVLEVRRITDETDFADHADNEYLQKEKEWRAAE